VNLILFAAHEIDRPLSRSDRRASHILETLRRGVGDEFDAGLLDGPRGKATLAAINEQTLTLTFRWGAPPPPLDPITVIVGLPRPQTARDLLRELTALGVAHLHFVTTEKTEPGYASSTLWSSGEWQRQLIAGAAQAFDTRLPQVTHGRSLEETLVQLSTGGARLALDNYEASEAIGRVAVVADLPAILALGAERGWSNRERSLLREHGFVLVHLGPRVLRVETAAIAAVAILQAKRATP
jgi:16S rRNA (uracil1498-N3)-methyltransferase